MLVLDGFDTQSIGFLAPAMAESLQVPVKTFGPVFAAALLGLMISSMTAGPIADRLGRKWPIVTSTLIFATFALITTSVSSLNQLMAYRFLTGLGLGGAMPNVVALTSEYAPKKLQQILVTMLFCGMPLGAFLGGIVSAVILPIWGWRAVFYVGGILPIVVALVLIKILPESIRFLALTSADRTNADGILSRISPGFVRGSVDYSISVDKLRTGVPFMYLFTQGRAVGTLLLWIPFFMNLLILYFIVSWLPALLLQTHMPLSGGIIAVSVFSLGGVVGSLLQGRPMRAWGGFATLLTEFVFCAILIRSLAVVTGFPLLIIVTFLLGIFVQGAQAGLNALAATFYPTSIRSTGVGWALGLGRLGSIAGPVFGGIMMSLDWSARQILAAGAIPAILAAAAILASHFLRSNTAYHLQADPDL